MANNNAKKTTPHRGHNHNRHNHHNLRQAQAEAAAEAKAQAREARMDARIDSIMASTERMVADENKTLVALNAEWVSCAKVLFEKVDSKDAVKALEVLTSTMTTMQEQRLDAADKALNTIGELVRDGAKAFAGLATMRAQQTRAQDESTVRKIAELETEIRGLRSQLAAEQVDRVTEKLQLKIRELERELGYEE